MSSVLLQHTVRQLDRAFRSDFEGRAKYPTLQQARERQAATYASSAFRIKLA